jgi:hypothetical protein
MAIDQSGGPGVGVTCEPRDLVDGYARVGHETDECAARVTRPQIVSILRKAGRIRSFAEQAEELQTVLHRDELRQPEPVETAMGQQALALLRLLDAARRNADELAAHAEAALRHRLLPRLPSPTAPRTRSPLTPGPQASWRDDLTLHDMCVVTARLYTCSVERVLAGALAS